MVKLSVQLNDFELDFFLNYTNAPYPLISIELRHPIYLFCSIGVLFCTHFQAKVNLTACRAYSPGGGLAQTAHTAAHLVAAKESSPESLLSPLLKLDMFK